MRKEDEEAIIRAVEILKLECDKHKRCKGCKLYVMGCLLDRPPAYYDTESIVKCFTWNIERNTMDVERYFNYLDKLYNIILDGYVVTINGERRRLHDAEKIFNTMYGLYGTHETLVQSAKKLRIHYYG